MKKKMLCWSLKDGRIVFNGKRSYSIFQMSILSFFIRFLSVVLIILACVRLLSGNRYSAVISLFVGVFIFLYGRRFRKIALEAKKTAMLEIMKEVERKNKKG